jgi:hypothetical protein
MTQLHNLCLPNIINRVYFQQLTEIILPYARNIVGIYRQISVLALYQDGPGSAYHLKFTLYVLIYQHQLQVIVASGVSLDHSKNGSGVRIPLGALINVRSFLRCFVLCKWRHCTGTILSRRSPTNVKDSLFQGQF